MPFSCIFLGRSVGQSSGNKNYGFFFGQNLFRIIHNHNPTTEANDANDGSVRDGRHPQALCLPLHIQGGSYM